MSAFIDSTVIAERKRQSKLALVLDAVNQHQNKRRLTLTVWPFAYRTQVTLSGLPDCLASWHHGIITTMFNHAVSNLVPQLPRCPA